MQYKRINFSKNWNNKLLCNVFSDIKPANSNHKLNDVCDIRIDDRFYCYAKIVKIETKSLSDIISFGINFLDSGMDEKSFLDFISKAYSKKSWWKDKETEMKIIFFEKISQLTIFEDGKYATT